MELSLGMMEPSSPANLRRTSAGMENSCLKYSSFFGVSTFHLNIPMTSAKGRKYKILRENSWYGFY
ncbi:hypothetical protein HYC85_029098 [Camellia sinensis]|uniref:Uncharacterized protein n=1 Tax=Camellia sinensis TaxID=4442 RepID=A0A7J7FXQ2_CAMSI|nr:hypothetical protein HYC85_029098 [Camellia sinensis]